MYGNKPLVPYKKKSWYRGGGPIQEFLRRVCVSAKKKRATGPPVEREKGGPPICTTFKKKKEDEKISMLGRPVNRLCGTLSHNRALVRKKERLAEYKREGEHAPHYDGTSTIKKPK